MYLDKRLINMPIAIVFDYITLATRTERYYSDRLYKSVEMLYFPLIISTLRVLL